MIKKLQRRFILIAVSSVAAVLLIIMGAICVSNYIQVISDADRTISFLEENNGNYPKLNDKNLNNSGIGAKLRQEISPEAPFETRFFTVNLDESGDTISVNTGSIAAVTSTEAIEYAKDIYDSGKQAGFFGVYRYKAIQTESGIMVLFLDCSRGLSLFYKFLETSLGVSLVGILGVLLLVMVFSKRAIKPIADSYEKQKHFITDASHELKTPLTVINANTEVLEMTQGESEWTQSIRNQVSRLSELTNSLVSLARMDESDSKLIMTSFSISDAVTEAVEPFIKVAQQKGKSLEMHIQANLSYEGNEESIRKLVGILADNAIKYSGEKGNISISLKSHAKGTLIQIKNSVDSIEIGNHDELFERFYRGDESHSSQIGGFGIGLSIARAIVYSHKGKIAARSDDGKSLMISVML